LRFARAMPIHRETIMTARESYEAGKLDDAVQAALAEVKAAPGDSPRRAFLAELSCFAGDLERADRQLDLIGEVDPKSALGVTMFRQLVRAEQARRQFFSEGRVPEFLSDPSETLKLHLQASIRLREGDTTGAAAMLAEAEVKRPKLTGTCDGQEFDDFRDLDDLTSCFFELLTSNGKYYWVPFERIESVEFRPPARTRDLLWRRARMIVRGGPDGEVFLPCVYAGSHAESEDALRLGRATDWRGGSGAPMRGAGQRTFLIGDGTRTILELKELAFSEVAQ
jgi:type VI secretion system protein ImpE